MNYFDLNTYVAFGFGRGLAMDITGPVGDGTLVVTGAHFSLSILEEDGSVTGAYIVRGDVTERIGQAALVTFLETLVREYEALVGESTGEMVF